MQAAKRILIVEDDVALRRSLAEQLALGGEFVSSECGAAAALAAAAQEPVDAILVDVALPDPDARELCRRLRAAAGRVPILMLTEADGRDAGADDYVAKPIRLGALLAQLRAHLRHSRDAAFRIGPYTFRPDAKLLVERNARRQVRLTEKETAILEFLCRAGGRAIARGTLLGEVWGYQPGVATHTLETHVYRLRRKIERDPARAEILVTAPGGYRLVP